MKVYDDTAKRRLRFQTRRGLLELDLIFGRFMAEEFDHLDDGELALLEELLTFQDQELLPLLNGHAQTEKEYLLPIINKLRQA